MLHWPPARELFLPQNQKLFHSNWPHNGFAASNSLPYGIFYRANLSPPVRKFLDFIRLTYGEGNSSGIVPVLI